jgi:methylmalonyl-CoA mutase
MSDPTPASLGLRDDFPVPSLDQWHDECVRLLRGASFEKTMLTSTYEGITLQPLYTRADGDALPAAAALPGQAPFVRGTRPLGYRQQPWQVAQELPYPTVAQFNEAVLHDLERGQNAVVLTIDAAGRAGRDPDEAPAEMVGRGGTSLASLTGLEKAMAGVDLGAVPVHLQAGPAAAAYAALLVALARRRGMADGDLKGSVGCDPLADLAAAGALPAGLDGAYDEVAMLTRWALDHAPGLSTVTASGHVWHDGGGSAVQELALTLAAAVEHLRRLEVRGLDPLQVAPRIRFEFSVGTQFFMEIARMRAARLLWSRIVTAAGGAPDDGRMTVFARTSRFTKTVLDPYVNVLRGTTEAMAAILAQVDGLHVSPFDEALGLPDAFSRRLARNTQTILREESHLDLVGDPGGGSWYVERLTAEVAAEAWSLFQEIEAAGGMAAALASGDVARRIAATAGQRRRNLARRRDVLVGTNRSPNAGEKPLARRTVDHAALHTERTAAMQAMRTGGHHEDDQAVLARLASLLEQRGPDAFGAVVDAAMAGATVGELTRTLRHDAAAGEPVTPVTAWRAGEMFERLRAAVEAHADKRAVTVFCACLGNVARYMPRLDFVRGFFQTGGFAVDAERFFATPEEAATAAAQTGTGAVIIVGADATYADMGCETARRLKAAGIATVMLAGQPGDLAGDLESAGVDQFIHLRSDAHGVLENLARTKGVAL